MDPSKLKFVRVDLDKDAGLSLEPSAIRFVIEFGYEETSSCFTLKKHNRDIRAVYEKLVAKYPTAQIPPLPQDGKTIGILWLKSFTDALTAFFKHCCKSAVIKSDELFSSTFSPPVDSSPKKDFSPDFDSVCRTLNVAKEEVTLDDFDLLHVVGRGSVGKVFMVRKKDNGQYYALKTILKAHIIKRGEERWVTSERQVLEAVSHPFLVNLHYAFQTRDRLMLVLDFVNGGDLFHYLGSEKGFGESRTRFYGACIISALAHLHQHGVIYRDLKPENMLFDCDGFVHLTDFGMCKQGLTKDATTATICGTSEYVSPEVILHQPYARSCDFWSLGVCLYEMMVGDVPFHQTRESNIYVQIVHAPIYFPPSMSKDAVSLLKGLLDRNPSTRLGCREAGVDELKGHAFFKSIDWALLEAKGMEAPWKPKVKNNHDVSCFDAEFLSLEPTLDPITDSLDKTFSIEGYTYAPPAQARRAREV